jgi:hypothetical protein
LPGWVPPSLKNKDLGISTGSWRFPNRKSGSHPAGHIEEGQESEGTVMSKNLTGKGKTMILKSDTALGRK